MKAAIHPKMIQESKAKCLSCNTVFEIPSTIDHTDVEACRNCHPVYTGKTSGAVKGGRVERFRARQAKGKEMAA
jgi:large subunit ribosomal protein L31